VEENKPQDVLISNKNSTQKKNVHTFAVVIVSLVAMFGLGWLVGDGRISVNSVDSTNTNTDLRENTIEGLDEIYDELVKNYDGDIDAEAFSEGVKRGGVASVGDNFTEYLSPVETSEFNASLDGTFEGIGAELGKEGNFVLIVAPIKGAPAEKAGIQPRDVIIEIDGEDATDISISEAVQRIRGEKGTDVTLTLIREGEQVEATITRDTIDIPSVEWRVEDGVGIIEISRFGTDTGQLVRQAATELTGQNIEKIILDLRGNPGGLLDQSVQVSDVWLPKGAVIVEEKRGGEVIKSFTATNNPIFTDVETVILINEGSASASEIVAGALRDNGVATLIGQTSFGKGSVQQLINLSNGGSLKVTIARWFTPEGKNIDKEGITPDTEVELSAEDREAERDPQLDAAKELLQ
jgi:carboxyl-terminal processing protease